MRKDAAVGPLCYAVPMTKNDLQAIEAAILEGIKAAIVRMEEKPPDRRDPGNPHSLRMKDIIGKAQQAVQRELAKVTPSDG
jgi:hypothetical protein